MDDMIKDVQRIQESKQNDHLKEVLKSAEKIIM
jgi:hypothetical protein